MATLYVTEYSGLAFTQIGGQYASVPKEPPLADYTVTIPGISPTFQNLTTLVRLECDSICSVLFGAAPSATTSNGRMAANQTEYRGVPQGLNFMVSVVSNV